MTNSRRSILWQFFCGALTLAAFAYFVYLCSLRPVYPHNDEYFMVNFLLLEVRQSSSLLQIIDSLWWTYIQHRMLIPKAWYLLLDSLPTAHYWTGMLAVGAFFQVALAWLCYLCARRETALPAMSALTIVTLWTLAPYSTPLFVFPMPQYAYTQVMALSLAAIYCLSAPRPRLLAAILLMWAATFTFGNGLFVVVIGTLIAIYRHIVLRDLPRPMLLGWLAASALLTAVYLANMNVFSEDLFGAKTVDNTFSDMTQRSLDFLASFGAIPVLAHNWFAFKVALGSSLLLLTLYLVWRDRHQLPLALAGGILFCIMSLFASSLFRYSAATNPGYQNLTALFQLLLLLWLLRHTSTPKRTVAIVLCSLLIFVNAAVLNTHAIRQEIARDADLIRTALLDTLKEERWKKLMLDESRRQQLFAPALDARLLQTRLITAICPPHDATRPPALSLDELLLNRPNAQVFAIDRSALAPQAHVFVCGTQQAWRVEPLADSTLLLLDKQALLNQELQLVIGLNGQYQASARFTLTDPLPLTPLRLQRECQQFAFLDEIKSMHRVRDYFCQRTLAP